MAWPALISLALSAASAARNETQNSQQERLNRLRLKNYNAREYYPDRYDDDSQAVEAGLDLALRIFGTYK